MKANKFLSRAEYRKERMEREKEKEKEKKKEEDNEENEEEEDDEEEEEKNKVNVQKQKPIPSSRPIVNKDIKTIIKRDEKPIMTSHTFNRRIIYMKKDDNNNPKDGSNVNKDGQEKIITSNIIGNRIIKKDSLRTNQSHPFSLKMIQSSSKGQLLKNQTSSNNVSQTQTPTQTQTQTKLKPQNSQSHLLRAQIPSKIESQPQASQNNRYTRRVMESTVNKEENNKEIKIIHKNNNYTINVTNNNNTINFTNTNNNNNDNVKDNNDNEKNKSENERNEEDKKEEVIIETKKVVKKQIRTDFKNEPIILDRRKEKEKEKEREVITKKSNEKYNIKKDEEKINTPKKEETNYINKTENKKDNKLSFPLTDRRKEYVNNDTLIKNGIEIYEFSPEETQKVLEKKKESKELIKMKKEEKMLKKQKYMKTKKNGGDNNTDNNKKNNNNNEKEKEKEYYEKKTHHNNHKSFANFYIRGKDNFSRRNIHDREIYTHRDNYGKSNYNDDSFDYDDNYDDFNNKSFVGLESFNNRRGYKKNTNRYDTNVYNRRINNNFYERGRPNPIFRGFRGRRGRGF